jgi:hypothetical protein
MIQELTASVRRWAGIPESRVETPLVRLDDAQRATLATAHSDIASLRGVTGAAADVAECACPEACERDHANE